MYKTNVSETDDFLIYEIVDERNNKIDSVVINKYTPETVLHFYGTAEDYIEEYERKMRELQEEYEGRVDFDNALENRSNAEFRLYSHVMGID